MKIQVLIENSSNDHLLCEHGLSFYIQYHDHHYLLDASQSDAFMHNAKQLNIDLSLLDYAILSHGHYDHGNGFTYLLAQYPLKIYAMANCVDSYYSNSKGTLRYIGLDQNLKSRYYDHFHFIDQVTVLDDFYLIPHSTSNLKQIGSDTGLFKKVDEKIIPDDFSHELSVVFKSEKGLIIINSCSHAGFENIVEEVKKALPNEKIYAYIGGLHLKQMVNGKECCRYDEQTLKSLCDYIQKEQIQKIYCGHCSGNVTYELLKAQLKDIMNPLYSGLEIKI